MFNIGVPELMVIAVVALLIVGPKKLPDLAKSLAKGLAEFRKAADDVTSTVKDSLKADDLKTDLDDLKNSLLYGKKDDDHPHDNQLSSTAEEDENESSPSGADAKIPQ
ncbi:MAG: twin-arginine translocase subunit TatB [Deltaproteobacteria bacterium]|nr:twin-arginine translocase subunit TatB [Deltaproteobacteria bacterium]